MPVFFKPFVKWYTVRLHNVTIPKEEQDRCLTDKLMDESEGILSWAVKGCILWQSEGLGDVPVSCEHNIQVVRRSSIEDFIKTSCDVRDGLLCKTLDLYTEYLGYHEIVNDETEPISFNVFCVGLSNLGIPYSHHRDGNYRVGIAIKVATT